MWENCHDYDPEVEKQVGKPARTALTNEQKAKRLEQMAESRDTTDAALLRESAAMLRERDDSPARWSGLHHADYKGCILHASLGSVCGWDVYQDSKHVARGIAGSLDAAQAAAVAWVDEQEGK